MKTIKLIFIISILFLNCFCFSQEKQFPSISIKSGKNIIILNLDEKGIIKNIISKDKNYGIDFINEKKENNTIIFSLKKGEESNKYLISVNEKIISLSEISNINNEIFEILKISVADKRTDYLQSFNLKGIAGKMTGKEFIFFKKDSFGSYCPDYVFVKEKDKYKIRSLTSEHGLRISGIEMSEQIKYSYKFMNGVYITVFKFNNGTWVLQENENLKIEGMDFSSAKHKVNVINYLILSRYDENISTYFIPLALYFSN